MYRIVAFVVALLFIAPVQPVQGKAGNNQISDIAATVGDAAFTTLAMNVTRTLDAIEVDGADIILFNHDFVHNSATAVTMTCSGSNTEAGTFRPIQVLQYAASTATSDTNTWSQAVTGNEAWPWLVQVNAHRWMQCTWTATSGAAGDTLTVTIHAVEF